MDEQTKRCEYEIGRRKIVSIIRLRKIALDLPWNFPKVRVEDRRENCYNCVVTRELTNSILSAYSFAVPIATPPV